jgi:hypothetical protein
MFEILQLTNKKNDGMGMGRPFKNAESTSRNRKGPGRDVHLAPALKNRRGLFRLGGGFASGRLLHLKSPSGSHRWIGRVFAS